MISHGVSPNSEDKIAKKNSLNHNHNNNSMKHPLKRVSFGSSKGSMVETLIYDHPLPEEDGSYYERNITRFGSGLNVKKSKAEPEPELNKQISETPVKLAARVKVTFFESEKPHYVSSPESGDTPLEFDIPAMSTPSPTQDAKQGYLRQESTDSGKDNPFRPDGDLSREADEIVQMIKGGRPITSLTPTPELPEDKFDGSLEELASVGGGSPQPPSVEEGHVSPTRANAELGNAKAGANGNAPLKATTPEAVEVQRGVVVPPSDAAQIEHVVIKKKPKCKCCEIM